ncbi:putative 3 exoribonuclease family protein [Venturia nashicola]|uniref:Ribosomal RNA-processing protein 42 n=1 Tax=Venturia nashicola TaxID=86259 RepID=A0A4Z1P398_9PEZI|nr:putative 3 exoribonuclease family protein [Venturia nashicola]TLD34935.1 putative 3 exoribonuclease family protein [Venturia nashicola]
MPPSNTSQILLSPAELSYLHSSLSLSPPIRPDGRTPTQFRPLVAESGILPSANGSARICFGDGTEAIVGVKAEVEKSIVRPGLLDDEDVSSEEEEETEEGAGEGEDSWTEISIEVPDFRDDDALPIFLAAMLTEALLADGKLKDRLCINRRFHWKLYIDILLLSTPLSYPLPLLSLTTHLALLSTRLPSLKSEGDEDPLFNDDWEESVYLYPFTPTGNRLSRPPITLLVMSIGTNYIFDPSKEELAVAEAVVAISVGSTESEGKGNMDLKLLALRTIDPPSRLTTPGIPNSLNNVATGDRPLPPDEAFAAREGTEEKGVWNPPRGGMKRGVLAAILKAVVKKGGIGEEVMEGLLGVEL